MISVIGCEKIVAHALLRAPQFLILLLIGCQLQAAVVDRVAVIVGRRVVKASDIERDLRVSQFLNRQPLDLSPDTRKKAADRLIDQELIRQEMLNGGYNPPSEKDAAATVEQLRRDRFAGSDGQLQSALTKYGLSNDGLREYFLFQLTVLRFIDQRFRPGVLVTDEDVQAYYKEHRAELQKSFGQNNTPESLEPKIRELITGERVNELFEEWLDQTRRRTRVEFREGAFK